MIINCSMSESGFFSESGNFRTGCCVGLSVGLGREACLSGSTVSDSGLEVEEPEKSEDSPCWSGSAG